jgi:hypothetical protein
MNSLIERDIDELSKAMAEEYKVKWKAICHKRMAEMIAKIYKGPCSTCNATSKVSTCGGVPHCKVSDGNVGQGEKTREDDDGDITEKISSMVIDIVNAAACLESSNANPSTHRNSESRTINRDDIPSFDLFGEGDPEFDFMYGDDMVGTKIGKQVTQPTTTAPILGFYFSYSHLLISILLFVIVFLHMFTHVSFFARCCHQDGCQWQQNELMFT